MQTEVSYLLLCSIWHVQTWENLFVIEQWFQLRLAVFLLLQWHNLAVEFSAFWFICTVLYGDALYLPRDIQSFYATPEACLRLALSWSPPAVTCISNRLEQGSGKSQKEDLLLLASYVHPFILPRSKGTDFRNSQCLILSNSSTLCILKSHFNIALILNNVIQNTVYKQTSDSSLFGLGQHHCTDQDILQTFYIRQELINQPLIDSDQIKSLVHVGTTLPTHIINENRVVTLKCKWNWYSNVHICSFGLYVDCLQSTVRVKDGHLARSNTRLHSGHSSPSSINTDVAKKEVWGSLPVVISCGY